MNKRKISSSLLLCLLLLFLIVGCVNKTEEDKTEKTGNVSLEKNVTEQIKSDLTESSLSEKPFEITMLDVGQGLCILLRSGDCYMLYDGGGRKKSSYVVAYLKNHEITTLDYVIVSHYDEDHLSGLVGVMNTFSVDKVITPDYVADSMIYQSFEDMKAEKKVEEVHAYAGDRFDFGDARISVLSPDSYDYEKENNNSIVVKVEQNGFSCLLTGDAEREVEEELLFSGTDVTADLYVASHHGSASSNSEEFIEAVAPDYAFISVGAENSYGHPAETTLENLEKVHTEIYRSDLQGEVTISCLGNDINLVTQRESNQKNTEKTVNSDQESQNPGNSEQASSYDQNSQQENENYRYMINMNTKVFHEKGCKSIDQMKEKNKKETLEDRDTLIEEGYKPCGNCKP